MMHVYHLEVWLRDAQAYLPFYDHVYATREAAERDRDAAVDSGDWEHTALRIRQGRVVS